MSTYHDYESMGWMTTAQPKPELLETYAGTQVVLWHGRIERQLNNLLNDADKGRNWDYANKIREYLKIWRQNELTGSINRETLDTLKGAADILAVDSWNLASYFSNLRDQLRVLVASEEELPRGMDMNQNDPMAGPSGSGGGAPPMSPSFGPDTDMPSGMDTPPGAGGEPGAEGAPGAAEGEPGGEPGAEGAPGEPTPGEPKPPGGPPDEGEESLKDRIAKL